MKKMTQYRELFSAVVFTFFAVFGATSSFAAEDQTAQYTDELAQIEFVSPSVNINSASADELAQALSGVGVKKAQEIVAFRQANGRFAAGVEITAVKGIGAATFEKNKSRIAVE